MKNMWVFDRRQNFKFKYALYALNIMTIKVTNYLYSKEVYSMVDVKDTVYVLCLSERHFCNGKLLEFSEKFNKVLGVYKEYADAKEAALEYCRINSTMFKDNFGFLDDKLQRWYETNIGNIVCEEFSILCRRIIR